MPSTNELAWGYNINPATAAKGINMLGGRWGSYTKKKRDRYVRIPRSR